MTLHACVRCGCFERGLVAYTPLAPRIHVDEEDGDLVLDPPPGMDRVPDEDHENLRIWRATACSHPDMYLVQTRVGNWHHCDALREALLMCADEASRRGAHALMARPHGDGMLQMEHSQRYGPVSRFATLLDELPDHGMAWGWTSPALARRMLNDLRIFERRAYFGIKFVLRDVDSGEALWTTLHGEAVWNELTRLDDRWWTRLPPEWNDPRHPLPPEQARLRNRRPARDGHLFAWHGTDLSLGVIRRGFVVQDGRQRILFRSRAFTQTPLAGGKVRWQDDASGQGFECAVAIGTRPARALRLCVEAASQTPADHGAVTGALRSLCIAAVESGHPIEWS